MYELQFQPCCCISIHTPTKGVTFSGFILHKKNQLFHSTLPRIQINSYQTVQNFNPHSHEGSDLVTILIIHAVHYISIHTPTKGVTCASMSFRLRISISIHTPTKGVTVASLGIKPPTQNDFNPHSHEGSDHSPVLALCLLLKFQSTLPRRE